MKQIKFFLNNQSLPIALILFTFFIIYRIFVLSSIHSQRDLPIEVDDSYVYISQAHMFYDNYNRKKETTKSIRSITQLTFKNDLSDDIQNLTNYDTWTSNRYFLYSAALGFFTKKLKVDPIKAWWQLAYFTQILIAISIFLMIYLYVGKDIVPFSIASIFGIFISLEIIHQIMATPMTIANSLLLIGWFCINKISNKKLLPLIGYLFIACALHVHAGAFVILGMLSFSSLVFWYLKFKEGRHHRNIFLGSLSIASLSIIIESFFVFFLNGEHYLSVIGYTTYAKIRHGMGPIELVLYNFPETLFRLKEFSDLNSFQHIGLFLFVPALIITFKLNKKVFIINLIFLLGNIAGLIHYVPYHRGELIEYTGQTQIIFILMSFSYLYLHIILLLKKNKKNYLIFVSIFFLIFFIDKFVSTSKQIDGRSSRHNFEPITQQIKNYVESQPKNKSIIIGDEFVYLMLLSEISDRSIMLADHLRKGEKPWSIPKDFPIPSAYIGKPLDIVEVGGVKYNITKEITSKRIIFSNIDKK